MSTCPKCRAQTLNAVQSASAMLGLSAVPLRCARCKGFWISLGAVSALRDSGAIESLESETSPDEQGDKRAGMCPVGHGLMSRVKASWRRPFYIERCRHCDGIWLDAGEWRRLGAEHLLDHLEELWTPGWRHKLQEEQSTELLEEFLGDRLGTELADRIDALAIELAAHPHGDLAVARLEEMYRARRPRKREA